MPATSTARAGSSSSTGCKDIATDRDRGARSRPQFIENKLKFSPYIGECVVLGNGRPWLAAILCMRYSMVARWAEGRRHRRSRPTRTWPRNPEV